MNFFVLKWILLVGLRLRSKKIHTSLPPQQVKPGLPPHPSKSVEILKRVFKLQNFRLGQRAQGNMDTFAPPLCTYTNCKIHERCTFCRNFVCKWGRQMPPDPKTPWQQLRGELPTESEKFHEFATTTSSIPFLIKIRNCTVFFPSDITKQ